MKKNEKNVWDGWMILQQESKKGNSKIRPKYLYQAPTYNKASPLENDASSHTFSMWIGFWLGAPKQRRKKFKFKNPLTD